MPVSAVLLHSSSVFSELLTGKPLCLPCLSTRFTSMDTPFQVRPHYCLLSPMHPIFWGCFNTFSWHDFESNHLPIIATHGLPKHLTRGSWGSPKPRALLAGASWQPALLLRRRRIFPVVVISVVVTWTRYENIWTVAVVQSPQVAVPGGSSRPHIFIYVTPFLLYSSSRIIMNFRGGITIDKSDVHAKRQGQKSKVKVTEVKTNFAPIWAFPARNSSLNLQMATKLCTKLEVA